MSLESARIPDPDPQHWSPDFCFLIIKKNKILYKDSLKFCRDICSQIMNMLKPADQKQMNGTQKMLNAPVQLGTGTGTANF
jgi:hypothetical protein